MLLIGSRALKFHYPDARDPKDWDLIATNDEVERFLLSNRRHKETTKYPGKRRFVLDLNGKMSSFEFEIVDLKTPTSGSHIWSKDDVYPIRDFKLERLFGGPVYYASPKILFLLKRSHITFPIHFWKNIADYHFLKEKLGGNIQFDALESQILNNRIQEIKSRIKKPEINFNLANNEFFKRSEGKVKRIVDHDSLHYAVSFGEAPLFWRAKEDLNKAELSELLTNRMTDREKVQMIQEETMVLAIERVLIPAALKKETIDAEMIETAFNRFAGKMCVHYLPEWLRMFAVDHFLEILTLEKKNFWEECLERHLTLKERLG